MRIAIFDYRVTAANPIGGCHLRMLRELCLEHEFTVFAAEFDNPCPQRIRWVRVPAVRRPLVLLFLTFHMLAPILYLWHRLRYRLSFDFVQMVESNLLFGAISYSHFCHRAFLGRHWSKISAPGLRGAMRWLDHRLHALLEPWVYRRVRWVVVPSHGLARELASEYPFASAKIRVLANAVGVEEMQRQSDYDRNEFRRGLGLAPHDVVLAFVALGHYERKGLPLVLEALRLCGNPRLKLVVVGGTDDLIASYEERVIRMGLSGRVVFTGMKRDVRPYLWGGDAFILPSVYETFSLVAFEAAAAALPLIVTPVYGVEDFVRDGENGLLIAPSSEQVQRGINRFLELKPEARRMMGRQAQLDVRRYRTEDFVAGWRNFYAEQASHVA